MRPFRKIDIPPPVWHNVFVFELHEGENEPVEAPEGWNIF